MKKPIIFICFVLGLMLTAKAQNMDEVIRFIKENPQKASIYLIENGKTTIDRNSNQPMPLASAVKTIIAIEFAKQASAKKFSSATKIPIRELAKYYLPNTDGGAQINWLKSLRKLPQDSVTLLEIAKGMIKFSANANTEYLEDFLGLKNINKNLTTLGLENHQSLYYFTAAALMVCLKPDNVEEQDWIAQLKTMPIAEYHKRCEAAHIKLKTDSNFIKTFNPVNLPFAIQKVWSDRLVASTTATYANLMQKIASKSYFDPRTQAILESIIEWPMEYAGNQMQFNHLGQKGGSTAFILTDAFYADLKNGDQLSCAFFFNDLSTAEKELISKNFGVFEANILTSRVFRSKLVEALR